MWSNSGRMELRDARTFAAQPGTKSWFTPDQRYEMHVSKLRSEIARELAGAGLFRAGLGDVVCTYRKLRLPRARSSGSGSGAGGARTPWLLAGDRVSLHDPESAFGALTLLSEKQISEMGAALDPANPAEAAAMLQLCTPATRMRTVDFVVEWADNADGPKTKKQREVFAQDYAGNSKGSGSAVVGWCVLRVVRRGGRQQFWSDMFRVYETEIFGTHEFAEFAKASGRAPPRSLGLPDTVDDVQRFMLPDEDVAEGDADTKPAWPRDAEIARDAVRGDFVVTDGEDSAAPAFRATLRDVEERFLKLDRTGRSFQEFLEQEAEPLPPPPPPQKS